MDACPEELTVTVDRHFPPMFPHGGLLLSQVMTSQYSPGRKSGGEGLSNRRILVVDRNETFSGSAECDGIVTVIPPVSDWIPGNLINKIKLSFRSSKG